MTARLTRRATAVTAALAGCFTIITLRTASTVRADPPERTPSCGGSVEQPRGEYLARDGTLHIHARGAITCYPGTNGHTPHLEVHVQLHGSGPYNFFNPGRGNVCDGWSCAVEDERYFNLSCGQRGTYTHFARLTGSWTDGVSTYPVAIESFPSKGSYHRAC
jgi:hypothetical protein